MTKASKHVTHMQNVLYESISNWFRSPFYFQERGHCYYVLHLHILRIPIHPYCQDLVNIPWYNPEESNSVNSYTNTSKFQSLFNSINTYLYWGIVCLPKSKLWTQWYYWLFKLHAGCMPIILGFTPRETFYQTEKINCNVLTWLRNMK